MAENDTTLLSNYPSIKKKKESESHSIVSDSVTPMDYIVHGILQARILEWVAVPSPGDLPNPGI